MKTFYEIIDGSSGNVIKDYPSEEAALAELTIIVETHGISEIRDLVLMRFDDGQPSLVAAEEGLVALLEKDAARNRIERERLSFTP